MNGFLLDTNVVLIAVGQPSLLSVSIRDAILAGPNTLSVISYWEIVLKCVKGHLDVGDPRVWWADAIEELAADVLPLRPPHIDAVYSLPSLHKDPFDRALIAQTIVEGLTFATTDSEIPGYASGKFRVLS